MTIVRYRCWQIPRLYKNDSETVKLSFYNNLIERLFEWEKLCSAVVAY